MKILLYEPDDRAGETICHALHREGYDVNWIKDFLNARSKILDERYDASLIEIDDCESQGLQLIDSWVRQDPKLLCVAIYRDQAAILYFIDFLRPQFAGMKSRLCILISINRVWQPA